MKELHPSPFPQTAGAIARSNDRQIHQIQYLLRTRPHITPIGRFGRLRLYDRAAVQLVLQELAAIDARRARERKS